MLWEYTLGGAIELTTSGDPMSRLAKSFILCNAAAQGANICDEQDPIKARLVMALRDTDTVEWKVEALPGVGCDKKGLNCPSDDLPGENNGGSGAGNKPDAYGKTKTWKTGKAKADTAQTGTGTGRFKAEWTGSSQRTTEAAFFSFEPDMSDEPHTPATYTRGSEQAFEINGTKETDVWRHNPQVGYKVSARINGRYTIEAIAKMDEIDAVRQEYINHLVSASSSAASLIMELPAREKLEDKDSLGDILNGDWSQSEYQYLLDKHLTLLANLTKTNVSAEAEATVTVISETDVDLPSGQTIAGAMRINSGWRNPERNERVGGVPTSRHMAGRALDIGAGGVEDYEAGTENRAKMMWVMWRGLQNAPATQGNVYMRYLMEQGTTGLIQTGSSAGSGNRPTSVTLEDDIGSNGSLLSDGIPDDFNNASHFHVETKPNLSVGD